MGDDASSGGVRTLHAHGTNRLILDTDGGVDDAQALLLLIAAGRAPDAITTVFGNVSLEAATDNVLAIARRRRAQHPGAQGRGPAAGRRPISTPVTSMATTGWAARRVRPSDRRHRRR